VGDKFRVAGGSLRWRVVLTILGPTSGRAGMLDPTQIRWKRIAVGSTNEAAAERVITALPEAGIR